MIALGILLVVAIVIIIYLLSNRVSIQHINKEEQERYLALKQSLNNDIQNLQVMIADQQHVLQGLKDTEAEMRQAATDQANEYLETQLAAVKEKFKQQEEQLFINYNANLENCNYKIKKKQEELADLEAKQLAYIEAQQREKEKQEKQDYYRMVISITDQQEIEMLRNVQRQFIHKDAIDKLIWEVYYKPAFDVLSSHIYRGTEKICGIYKITNLTNGQAYVGQSIDCRERARQHIKAGLAAARATNKLYQQMQDDKPENFTFEILEEVPKDKLNEREKYYIELYHTKEYGLNKNSGGA